jgi:hypothetical protein
MRVAPRRSVAGNCGPLRHPVKCVRIWRPARLAPNPQPASHPSRSRRRFPSKVDLASNVRLAHFPPGAVDGASERPVNPSRLAACDAQGKAAIPMPFLLLTFYKSMAGQTGKSGGEFVAALDGLPPCHLYR